MALDDLGTESVRGLHVVGIGASVDSLEDLKTFVAKLQPSSALTYVLALDPFPPSVSGLVNLLARETKLNVVEAVTGQPLRANRIFVTPPHASICLVNGSFRV